MMSVVPLAFAAVTFIRGALAHLSITVIPTKVISGTPTSVVTPFPTYFPSPTYHDDDEGDEHNDNYNDDDYNDDDYNDDDYEDDDRYDDVNYLTTSPSPAFNTDDEDDDNDDDDFYTDDDNISTTNPSLTPTPIPAEADSLIQTGSNTSLQKQTSATPSSVTDINAPSLAAILISDPPTDNPKLSATPTFGPPTNAPLIVAAVQGHDAVVAEKFEANAIVAEVGNPASFSMTLQTTWALNAFVVSVTAGILCLVD